MIQASESWAMLIPLAFAILSTLIQIYIVISLHVVFHLSMDDGLTL